jgi:hypothetical protein
LNSGAGTEEISERIEMATLTFQHHIYEKEELQVTTQSFFAKALAVGYQ